VVQQLNSGKSAKYDLLVETGRLFQPIAAEMLGPLNESSLSFRSWAAGSRLFQETTENPALCSSAYQSQFSTITPSYYTTASLAITSAFRFPFNFVFNPRYLYTRWCKIIIIMPEGAQIHVCALPSILALKVKGQGQMLSKSNHFQGLL